MKRIIFAIFILQLFLNNNVYSKNSYFQEGEKLFLKKSFEKSKKKFEKDIVFNPKNEKSYLYLAKIFNEEKNDIMEEQNLNTVILLNPKNEEAIFLLAILKIKKSDYSESEKLIKTFTRVCKILCEKKSELNNKLKSLQIN